MDLAIEALADVKECGEPGWLYTDMKQLPDTYVGYPAPSRDEGRRARVGGSGNWRKHLSAEVAAWTDDYVQNHLDPLFLDPGSERRSLRAHAN